MRWLYLGLGTVWAIRVVIPSTNSPMTLQRYAVFLYLQNLYELTSESCIKMGITSLNSAVLYIVSLCFLFYRSFASAQDDRYTLRMTGIRSGWHLNHTDTTNVPSLKVQNHERRYRKLLFCVPTVPKTVQNAWISIASVRITDNTRTDAMLKQMLCDSVDFLLSAIITVTATEESQARY